MLSEVEAIRLVGMVPPPVYATLGNASSELWFKGESTSRDKRGRGEGTLSFIVGGGSLTVMLLVDEDSGV